MTPASALAMESLQSCAKPAKWLWYIFYSHVYFPPFERPPVWKNNTMVALYGYHCICYYLFGKLVALSSPQTAGGLHSASRYRHISSGAQLLWKLFSEYCWMSQTETTRLLWRHASYRGTSTVVVDGLKTKGTAPWNDEEHMLGSVGDLRIQRYIDGLVQDCSNSSALAMELLQPCTKPSISSSMYISSNKQLLNHLNPWNVAANVIT